MMITRRAAALSAVGMATLPVGARAYRPGAGLEIARFDRPGESSVNSYILIGPRSIVILDGQRTAVEARSVAALARGLGLPVEAIVLSHDHPDHFGGLKLIADAFPQAPILASEATRDSVARIGQPVLAQMRGMFGDAMPASVPLPNRILRHNERLSLAGTEWVVDIVGPCESATGMTMLYSEAENVLFAADLFGNSVTPWLVDGTTRAWIAELERAAIRYQGVQTALPGHGAAAAAAPLITAELNYLRSFHALVRQEVQAGVLNDAGRARIRAAVEARYPIAPKVAPPPRLIEMNADAVAREIGNG
jgi:glyoxylase-like metal-dependent hydrolase (beta-lactamase superfamily II)